MNLNFEKMSGLIPAIIQDEADGSVLMLGYVNRASMQETLESRQVTFFSRSRQAIWKKGEVSGNFLELVSWSMDCDQDAVLFKVRPQGPTCHRMVRSCFEEGSPYRFLDVLESILDSKALDSPDKSYTACLIQDKPERRAQKVGEEAVETVIALLSNSDEDVIDESADLIFHLIVALHAKGLSFCDIVKRLEERHRSRSNPDAAISNW